MLRGAGQLGRGGWSGDTQLAGDKLYSVERGYRDGEKHKCTSVYYIFIGIMWQNNVIDLKAIDNGTRVMYH